MAKCKACGAQIMWIQMASGKMMPVDVQKIPYRTDVPGRGSVTLVTPEGRVVSGNMDLDSDKYGYVSHFSTCPGADEMRRIRQ